MSLFSGEHMDRSGGVIMTLDVESVQLTAASLSQIVFLCPAGQHYQVSEVRSVFSTASSSGTATLEYLTGTTAPGSGTAQTAAIALSGTVNTVVVTAPVAPSSLKTLGAGDRLNLIIAGTMTGLAGGYVQVTLKRVNT